MTERLQQKTDKIQSSLFRAVLLGAIVTAVAFAAVEASAVSENTLDAIASMTLVFGVLYLSIETGRRGGM